MGLLDRADNLVFVSGIGSDRDRTHSLADRSLGGSFRRIARAAIDQCEIAPVQREGVRHHLSNTGTAGKHRHFVLWVHVTTSHLFIFKMNVDILPPSIRETPAWTFIFSLK